MDTENEEVDSSKITLYKRNVLLIKDSLLIEDNNRTHQVVERRRLTDDNVPSETLDTSKRSFLFLRFPSLLIVFNGKNVQSL